MNLIKIKTNIFVLIVSTMFISCGNKGNLDYSENNVIANSVETKIDSTAWLKPSKHIRSIFEDSKGNLWFTSNEYVCMFDGTEFSYFTPKDGLPCSGQVNEDENGTILIMCGSELYSYNGKHFTSSHTLNPDTTGNTWDILPTDLLFQTGVQRFGNTPVPPGIFRYRNGEIDLLAFPVPRFENDDHSYTPSAWSGPVKGKDGMIWFGTIGIVIGFKDGVFTLIGPEKMGRKNDPRLGHIRGIYEDSKGNLWMADNGAGAFMYNGDTTINFTKLHHLDKGDREGNTMHRTFSIAEDEEGNMWFATVYSGVWRYDGKSFSNFTEKDGMPGASIIFKNKKGELLFCGGEPGAVYKFNGKFFNRVY